MTGRITWRIILTVAAVVAGCDRGGHDSAPPPVAASPPVIAPVAVAPEPPDAAVAPDDPLVTEAKETDPRSETVRIKINVSPAITAGLFWGRRKLGETRPAQPSLEIDRPRGTGPLDLVIRADGFLPHHVRVFTDRDDRISVRLVRPADAPGLLGYRRPAPPAATP